MLDRGVTRLIGALAMVGATLAIVFNVLHPRPDEIGDIHSVVASAADEGIWLLDHYVLGWTIGIALLAFIGISRSFTREPSASWGRIALIFGIGSAFLAFSTILVDGWGIKEASELGGDAAASVALVGESLLIGTIGTFFGFTPLLFGAAVLTSGGYPPLLGWTPVLSGLLGVLAGSIIFFSGFSSFTLNVLFPISSLLFTLWIGFMGYRLWKGAEEPAAAVTPTG